MTYLVAGITALWISVSSWFIGAVIVATGADSHAQAAADAAALAAIAESLPGGGARPQLEALRFATANGARLLACLCVPGATAVQVTVAVGRAHASARAVFEPDLLRPLDMGAELGRSNT